MEYNVKKVEHEGARRAPRKDARDKDGWIEYNIVTWTSVTDKQRRGVSCGGRGERLIFSQKKNERSTRSFCPPVPRIPGRTADVLGI